MSTFTSLKNYLRDSRYCIGFIKDYNVFDKFDYKKIHWLDLNGYKDGWFADPFIFESNERTFVVLAEEWYYPINHGRITRCKRKLTAWCSIPSTSSMTSLPLTAGTTRTDTSAGLSKS